MKKFVKKECPYRIGEFVFAKYISTAWLPSRITQIDTGRNLFQVRACERLEFASGIRHFDDAETRKMTDEEAMLATLMYGL